VAKGFDVTAWLKAQVGQSRADVLAATKTLAADTRQAVVEAQRGRMNMHQRAVISSVSKVDARVGRFQSFVTKLDKRPLGTTAADWGLYRDITVAWVENGCVKPEVLSLFKI